MNAHACAATTGLAILALLAGGCHQPSADTIDRLLIGEVLMHSQFSANLRALAVSGGRLSGSPNGAQAEQFVSDKLREYGLNNVHFEPFSMLTWRDVETNVTLLDDPPRRLEGATALGNSMSTPPGGITAEVVDLGQGTEEDFQTHADELDGKFVLARTGGLHRGKKMRLAIEHGAVGLLHTSPLPDRVRVGTCHDQPTPNPGIAIIGEHGEELSHRLTDGETIRINVQLEADAWTCQPRNVVAEIPGTGSRANEVVILCGHLDSWHLAEGAIDNGNGSATILETARALAAIGWKPRRTVRFIWFMGEEHGLFGSKAYAKAHENEFDDIVAVINVDMPGIPKQFATFGHPEIVDFLKSLQTELAGFELKEEIANAHWTCSDHAPFMVEGVCALALYGEIGPGGKHYHSTGDKYEVVDRRGTTCSSAVLAVLVRRLADAPERPTVRLDPATLDLDIGW